MIATTWFDERRGDKVTLDPRDAIPTAAGAVAAPVQHTGAVIIRAPSLTRARTQAIKVARAQRNLCLSRGLRRSRHCSVNRT
jgi:hypothetical protein